MGLFAADGVIDLPVSEIVDEGNPLVLSVSILSVSPCANVVSKITCEDVMVDDMVAVIDVALVVGATVVCNCATASVLKGICVVVCIGKTLMVCVEGNVDDIIFGFAVLADVGLVVVVCFIGVEDVVFKFVSSNIISPRVLPLTG